jgi:hypothetical protein
MVDDYHLDMLEHDGYLVAQGCVREDHPHAPPDRSRMSIVKAGTALTSSIVQTRPTLAITLSAPTTTSTRGCAESTRDCC